MVNWASLEQVGLGRDTPITLTARYLTVGRVLDLVMDQLSGTKNKFDRVYWVLEDGVITIATGAALNTRFEVRVYEMGDLTHVGTDVPEPRAYSIGDIDVQARGDKSGGGAKSIFDNATDKMATATPTLAERQKLTDDKIITVIKDSIGDDMWRPNGGGSIQMIQNKLVISQSPLGFHLLEKSMGGL